MFEQWRDRSDVGLKNISLQLQGQTGVDELGPEGPGSDSRLRTEGRKGDIKRDKHF